MAVASRYPRKLSGCHFGIAVLLDADNDSCREIDELNKAGEGTNDVHDLLYIC